MKWKLSGFADEISDNPAIQIAVLAALGARHIEVRSAWGVNIADFTDAQVRDLKHLLDDAGFGVSAIGSPIGKVPVADPLEREVARLERVMEIAQQLGTTYVRIFSFYPAPGQTPEDMRTPVMERMSALAEAAQKRGLTLLHENEKDIYGDTPERCADVLNTVNSPHLRAAWDAANFVQVGVTPYPEGWRMLQQYVEYLQVKDALLADGTVVPAGHGDGGVAEVVRELAASGYQGFASMEPHLVVAGASGGYSGPAEFGRATRAFARLTSATGVELT